MYKSSKLDTSSTVVVGLLLPLLLIYTCNLSLVPVAAAVKH